MIFFIVLLFVFGVGIGSFLNVLILRYNPSIKFFALSSIKGRSMCPNCKKKLSFKELIPIASFIFLRGKCSECGRKISLQYPIVEFLTGLIFVCIPIFFNQFFNFSQAGFFSLSLDVWYYIFVLLWILVFIVLLLIFAVDLKHFIIPNGLNLTLAILGIFITFLIFLNKDAIPAFNESFIKHYSLVFSPFRNVLLNHVLGFFLGFLFFFVIFLISRGKGMGFGDAKLAASLGVVLGWPDIAFAIIFSFIIGGFITSVFLLAKKKEMKDKVPFAPFFILGFLVLVFFGYEIVNAYFSIFPI